jgi:hypothetical protein
MCIYMCIYMVEIYVFFYGDLQLSDKLLIEYKDKYEEGFKVSQWQYRRNCK